MPQFDVHRIEGGALVVDCQSDTLSHLNTRVVAPLMRCEDVPAPTARLHPVFDFDGGSFVLATHLVTALPRRELGPPLASLLDQEFVIKNALDMLLSGV